MDIHIRLIKMNYHPNRNDKMWILFETGQIKKPILILTDYELDNLIEQIKTQVESDND